MILALGLVGLRTAFVGIGSAARGSNRVAMEAERKFIVGLLTSGKGGGDEDFRGTWICAACWFGNVGDMLDKYQRRFLKE